MIVTEVPTIPAVGDRLAIVGNTLKLAPLLDDPPTLTTTFPVVAPAGTGTMIDVSLQLEGVADTPLNSTALVPCVAPNPVPKIVTLLPIHPAAGDTDVTFSCRMVHA
jgi:hypothetical protein